MDSTTPPGTNLLAEVGATRVPPPRSRSAARIAVINRNGCAIKGCPNKCRHSDATLCNDHHAAQLQKVLEMKDPGMRPWPNVARVSQMSKNWSYTLADRS